MTCQRVRIGDSAAIICGTTLRRRCKCGRRATLLCDWKVPDPNVIGGMRTCDTPICDRCTVKPAPGKDLCRIHAAEFEAWKAAR